MRLRKFIVIVGVWMAGIAPSAHGQGPALGPPIPPAAQPVQPQFQTAEGITSLDLLPPAAGQVLGAQAAQKPLSPEEMQKQLELQKQQMDVLNKMIRLLQKQVEQRAPASDQL